MGGLLLASPWETGRFVETSSFMSRFTRFAGDDIGKPDAGRETGIRPGAFVGVLSWETFKFGFDGERFNDAIVGLYSVEVDGILGKEDFIP